MPSFNTNTCCCTCCTPNRLKLWLLVSLVCLGIPTLVLSLLQKHVLSITYAGVFIGTCVTMYILWFRHRGKLNHSLNNDNDMDAQEQEEQSSSSSWNSRKVLRILTMVLHIIFGILCLITLYIRAFTVNDPMYPSTFGFPESCMNNRPNCCRALTPLPTVEDLGNQCQNMTGLTFHNPVRGLLGAAVGVKLAMNEYWGHELLEEYADDKPLIGESSINPATNPSISMAFPHKTVTFHYRLLTPGIGFPDDFCIRLYSNPNSKSVEVSVHSKSRIGFGDQHVNQLRVESFKSQLRYHVFDMVS